MGILGLFSVYVWYNCEEKHEKESIMSEALMFINKHFQGHQYYLAMHRGETSKAFSYSVEPLISTQNN